MPTADLVISGLVAADEASGLAGWIWVLVVIVALIVVGAFLWRVRSSRRYTSRHAAPGTRERRTATVPHAPAADAHPVDPPLHVELSKTPPNEPKSAPVQSRHRTDPRIAPGGWPPPRPQWKD